MSIASIGELGDKTTLKHTHHNPTRMSEVSSTVSHSFICLPQIGGQGGATTIKMDRRIEVGATLGNIRSNVVASTTSLALSNW